MFMSGIGDGVAVVRRLGLVVFENRVDPDGGKAHVGNEIQPLTNALEVAAMATVRVFAVQLFEHAGYFVVLRFTVGKTVGHNQVNGIALVKAFPASRSSNSNNALVRTRLPCLKSIFTSPGCAVSSISRSRNK